MVRNSTILNLSLGHLKSIIIFHISNYLLSLRERPFEAFSFHFVLPSIIYFLYICLLLFCFSRSLFISWAQTLFYFKYRYFLHGGKRQLFKIVSVGCRPCRIKKKKQKKTFHLFFRLLEVQIGGSLWVIALCFPRFFSFGVGILSTF